MRAFRLAYDGRPFYGFQRQPTVPTVERTLFDALGALGITGGEKPPGYAAAGRTDAGVSAVAQTVAFDAPPWCSPAALNSELPGSIRAWAAADVAEDFHARHAPIRREYTYFQHAPDADLDRARAAAAAFAGEHDFHNLTPDSEGTLRDLSIAVDRDREFLVLTVAGGGFARELVRRLVTVIHSVAVDEAKLERIEFLLGPDEVDGPAGVAPAAPTPLVLTDVVYDDATFEHDGGAVDSVHEVFGERYVDGLVRARVADAVCHRVDGGM
ncbi:MAG: tRNA pseudouridine(38-40) synthase TruA [Halobacteriota archaeon]